MDTLNRAVAPFTDDIWARIDAAAVAAARAVLSGRRFLPLEGPFGPGLTAIEVGNDSLCRQPAADGACHQPTDEAGMVLGRAVTVPMIRRAFRLSLRRLAAHRDHGLPLDLAPVTSAAEAVALREDDMIFRGVPEFGLDGLLGSPGAPRVTVSVWSDPDRVLADVVDAVGMLDRQGFRGPYALVLEPALYTGLFRRYPGSDLLVIDHLRRLCALGVVKAGIDGGVLVDGRVGSLVVGQDLAVGYVGQDGIHAELFVSESLVLRLDEPAAVCRLTLPS